MQRTMNSQLANSSDFWTTTKSVWICNHNSPHNLPNSLLKSEPVNRPWQTDTKQTNLTMVNDNLVTTISPKQNTNLTVWEHNAKWQCYGRTVTGEAEHRKPAQRRQTDKHIFSPLNTHIRTHISEHTYIWTHISEHIYLDASNGRIH